MVVSQWRCAPLYVRDARRSLTGILRLFRRNTHTALKSVPRFILPASFATWIGRKKKRMNSLKNFVLMSWWILFEVCDSLFIIVIIVSQIDLKICLVLTCWLTALNSAVIQGDQKRLLRERYLPYPKHKKRIDSNKLEIGACLKQTKIDIKLPYRWSRLLFSSFLVLPIIPRKPTRHDLGKDNHRATSTRIKRQTMP